MIYKFTYPIFIFLSGIVFSQANNECAFAQVLCASQSASANNFGATISVCPGCSDGASAQGNFCYPLNNTIWFVFETNNTGGDVSVQFSNLQCVVANGVGNGLQASVISANTPCNESSYSIVSNCETGSSTDFTLFANALLPNTTYYIQVDGTEGINGAAQCNFNIEISGVGVAIDIVAGTDQTIRKGEIATLSGIGPSGSIWTPPIGLSTPNLATTQAQPNITTTYTYSFTATNGCIYSDAVQIIIEQPLLITNTFTPNDDGINDFWDIINASNYTAIKINVFDRWGQQVFNTIGYTNDKRWDGKFLGRNVPPGTYFYVIDLNTGNKEDVFQGYVTVIR